MLGEAHLHLIDRLVMEPAAQIGQDCAHGAEKRVIVLEPLLCEIDDRKRPVVPVAVDWEDEELLGKDAHLLGPPSDVVI
jgi:hypothetical protein